MRRSVLSHSRTSEWVEVPPHTLLQPRTKSRYAPAATARYCNNLREIVFFFTTGEIFQCQPLFKVKSRLASYPIYDAVEKLVDEENNRLQSSSTGTDLKPKPLNNLQSTITHLLEKDCVFVVVHRVHHAQKVVALQACPRSSIICLVNKLNKNLQVPQLYCLFTLKNSPCQHGLGRFSRTGGTIRVRRWLGSNQLSRVSLSSVFWSRWRCSTHV